MEPKPYLSRNDIAAMLGISLRSLERVFAAEGAPEFVRPTPNRIVYSRAAVEQWIEARTVRPAQSKRRDPIHVNAAAV